MSIKITDNSREFIEGRASRNAALNAPNLSDEERRDLMVYAYDRAKEAGVTLKHDEEARRIIYGE